VSPTASVVIVGAGIVGAELVGGNPGFYRTGLVNPAALADHDKLRRNVARLREIGVETEVIGPEELVEVEPRDVRRREPAGHLRAAQRLRKPGRHDPRDGRGRPRARASSSAIT
jgi:glycine/D-amino acid oxidase-like deaminating enzyme